jgi:hypothetical protein
MGMLQGMEVLHAFKTNQKSDGLKTGKHWNWTVDTSSEEYKWR